MKVLMISTDRLIFKTGSEVRQRILDYGELFEEIHVIVFAKKNKNFTNFSLTDNCQVFSTNSLGVLIYAWDAIKIGKKLLDNSSDWIITSQDPFETGLVAWWLKKKFGLKWQAQIHTDFLSPFFARESWLNWGRVKLAQFLLPRADRIRVVSARIKKSLDNWVLKTKPIVLPIFVSAQLAKTCDSTLDLHQKYPQFSFIILAASRLTREKNLALALSAFASASAGRPTVGFVVVGQGPEKKNLQNLAQSFSVRNQIIFEDWQNDLTCYYKTADLFLLASNYEGYGRTMIEAGLNRCPVLATEIGLVGEILTDDNSLICPVGDEECLMEKISWAVAHHNQLRALGEKLENDLRQKIINNKSDYLNSYRQALRD